MVVMPLLALIYDQVTQLENKHISALDLSSWGGSVKWTEFSELLDLYQRNIHAMDTWSYVEEFPFPKIIFTTPEKISRSDNLIRFLEGLYNMNMIDRFVIDEAHCVSQWGHDFRKDYLNLKTLRETFPRAPILALTATAPERVRIDVISNLRMQNVLYF